MRLLLIMLLALGLVVDAEAQTKEERNINETFRCAEIVADHMGLDFDMFEVAFTNDLPPGTLGVRSHFPSNPEYSYVFMNLKELKDATFSDIRIVIAHELVHVKQVQDGHLHAGKFKGEDVSKYRYAKQPHEVEAYQLDDQLAKLCR